MRKKLLCLLVLILSFIPLFSALANTAPVEERFDSVTVPTLPSGWSSQSLVGSQNAVTTSASSDSAPNSAFIPSPGTITKTALNTKTYNFSTGSPTYALKIQFRHKRGMESSFDGGVFEVSYNGGAFLDILDPSLGAVFNSGGYNTSPTILNGFSNPLGGRKGWTGTSAVYESVSIKIPAVPDNTTLQFRFVIGTDNVVGAAGWNIDNFSLVPEVDTSVALNPLTTEISPGGIVPIDLSIVNPSSLANLPSFSYVSSAASNIKSVTLSKGGINQRIGKWISGLSLLEQTDPFSSDTYTVSIQDIPGRAAGKLTFLSSANPASSGLVGSSIVLTFLSSSPSIPNGSLSGEPVFGTIDPCAPPVFMSPTPETGKIVIAPGALTCPIGQAALAYQQRGAIAFISQPLPILGSPPAGDFPSPFVSEDITPGLTIPTLIYDFISGPISLFLYIGAPGQNLVSLEGSNGSELRTIGLSIQNIVTDDPRLGNNTVASLINVVTDIDSDGTPDIRDSCKTDSTKVLPGACGCGVADVDANLNNVFDCFPTADFKAQVNALKTQIKKLNLKSKSFRTQKSLVTNLKKQVATFGTTKSALVSVSKAGIDIVALTKKSDKAVALVLKAKSASTLATAKNVANKEISKLLAGIA